jgi:hypothetical protein
MLAVSQLPARRTLASVIALEGKFFLILPVKASSGQDLFRFWRVTASARRGS